MTYELIDRVPTLAEHRAVAEAVGWNDIFRWDAMEASIAGSICGTVVVEPAGRSSGWAGWSAMVLSTSTSKT